MAVGRKRYFGKQPAEPSDPQAQLPKSKSQKQQRRKKAEAKEKRKKETTPGKKLTELSLAKRAGLVKTAQRPFALFCKERKLRVQDAKEQWARLSESEKDEIAKMSKASFAEQRRQSNAAGVLLRKRQMTIQNDAAGALQPSTRRPRKMANVGGYAVFLKSVNKSAAEASQMWQQLPENERAIFREKGKEEQDNVNNVARTRLGSYIIKKTFARGRGAYGVVYLVENPVTLRVSAAKVETVEVSLRDEVSALQKLNHETILPVIDSCLVPGGFSYFVMPYVPSSLHLWLYQRHAFPHAAQLALSSQLLDGLGHIHSRSIVHADVKPSNILYDADCAYTLSYRPPELCVKDADMELLLTPLCDAWAAGITIIESLWQKAVKMRVDAALPPEALEEAKTMCSELQKMVALTPKDAVAYDFDFQLVANPAGFVYKLQNSILEEAPAMAEKLNEAIVDFEKWVSETLEPKYDSQLAMVKSFAVEMQMQEDLEKMTLKNLAEQKLISKSVWGGEQE
eukprot:Skav202422  [mRNA]  locus=scaffold1370:346656:350047:+ [translate_table: standard]